MEHVIEITHPQMTEPISNAPAFVLGVATVRGAPAVVVDAGVLVAGVSDPTRVERFVMLRAGGQTFALALGDLVGTETIMPRRLRTLPALLRGSTANGAASGLDPEQLRLLRQARILPDAIVDKPNRYDTAA